MALTCLGHIVRREGSSTHGYPLPVRRLGLEMSSWRGNRVQGRLGFQSITEFRSVMGVVSVLSSSGPTRIATREMNEDDYSTENTTGKRRYKEKKSQPLVFS